MAKMPAEATKALAAKLTEAEKHINARTLLKKGNLTAFLKGCKGLCVCLPTPVAFTGPHGIHQGEDETITAPQPKRPDAGQAEQGAVDRLPETFDGWHIFLLHSSAGIARSAPSANLAIDYLKSFKRAETCRD
jgi:hypothetical protein